MDSSDSTKDNDHVLFNKLTSLIRSSDKKIHRLETRAAQLAVADFIIQGFAYNQALHPSSASLLRGKWWVPFCLSASVSVAFFLTFLTTVRDCLTAKRQREAIFMDQQELYRKMHSIRGDELRKNDSTTITPRGRRRLAEAFQYVRYKRYAYAGVVTVALLLFNFLVLYAFSSG